MSIWSADEWQEMKKSLEVEEAYGVPSSRIARTVYRLVSEQHYRLLVEEQDRHSKMPWYKRMFT